MLSFYLAIKRSLSKSFFAKGKASLSLEALSLEARCLFDGQGSLTNGVLEDLALIGVPRC